MSPRGGSECKRSVFIAEPPNRRRTIQQATTRQQADFSAKQNFLEPQRVGIDESPKSSSLSCQAKGEREARGCVFPLASSVAGDCGDGHTRIREIKATRGNPLSGAIKGGNAKRDGGSVLSMRLNDNNISSRPRSQASGAVKINSNNNSNCIAPMTKNNITETQTQMVEKKKTTTTAIATEMTTIPPSSRKQRVLVRLGKLEAKVRVAATVPSKSSYHDKIGTPKFTLDRRSRKINADDATNFTCAYENLNLEDTSQTQTERETTMTKLTPTLTTRPTDKMQVGRRDVNLSELDEQELLLRYSGNKCHESKSSYRSKGNKNKSKWPSSHQGDSYQDRDISVGLMRNATPIATNRLVLGLAVVVGLAFALLMGQPVEGVDCFKCSSRNGSNPACEDPFHNLNTTRVNHPVLPDPPPSVIYHTPCYAGKKGREGLFPASACIKLTGTFDTTGETLVVRHCAMDSGTLTQDTELARMSHCGKFQFEGDLLKGCVLACPEDACNSAPSLPTGSPAVGLISTLLISTCLLISQLLPSARMTTATMTMTTRGAIYQSC